MENDGERRRKGGRQKGRVRECAKEKERRREKSGERLRVWEKVDAVMASSCRQPQASVILNRANSFTGYAPCAGPLYPRGRKILERDKMYSLQTSRFR